MGLSGYGARVKLSVRVRDYINDCAGYDTQNSMIEEIEDLEDELEFIHKEYGKAKKEKLTKDALWLKIASLEAKKCFGVE